MAASPEKDHSGVTNVTLRDYDDNYAPANKQLRLGLVGDTLFIDIEKPGEGDLNERPTSVANFAVKASVLEDAIALLKKHPG